MNSERVLVVSPHPDDETLGAGGTLLKYKQEGAETFWLNITDVHEDYGYSKEFVQNRACEIETATKMYQFNKSFNLKLKPADLSQYPETELIDKISAVVREIQPTTLILPYAYDTHSDHGCVFRASYACTKSFRYPSVKKVLAMEILSETDFANPQNGFIPNYFVNITNQFGFKLDILMIYKSELSKPPFPRSIENTTALATLRGSTAGFRYAESFLLLKSLID